MDKSELKIKGLVDNILKNKKDYDPTFDKIEEGMSGAVKKRILL